MIPTLVPRAPVQPDELAARAVRPGSLRDVLVTTYGEARLNWSAARGIQGRRLREARHLHSSERRFAGDLLVFLVRHHRTLAALVEAAGLSDSATSRQIDLARVLAAGVLLGGGRPADGPEVDWAGVADAPHTITGWARGRDDAEVFGVAASLPHWLASELVVRDDAVALAASLNRRAPLTLRVNRGELPNIEGARPTSLAARGLVLEGHVDVNSLPEVRDGRLEVQDEGSQLVAEICDPRPGERILDLCAGALGKSLALAAMTDDRATIVANDPRRDVVKKGLKRARRCGFSSIRPGRPEGGFDLVLVDAPCSGTGALRRRPWSRWSTTAADVARLPADQLGILRQGADHLRPGGRLVYATCSLLRRENEDVVDAALQARPDLRRVPLADVVGEERAERIGSDGVLKLEPHRHGTDGFFAAILTRS